MKKYAFLLVIFLSILSCKKQADLLEPNVDFLIGYLTDEGGAVHVADYENQDTIIKSVLDTALAIRVIEKNLEILDMHSLDLEKLKFTIYINTLLDNEKFTTDKNVYSIGRGMGENNINQLASIDNSFIIPLRMTDIKINDNKIELYPENDYIRISYESNYTGLSKVKTIIIKN
jgi:hypothetical protein